MDVQAKIRGRDPLHVVRKRDASEMKHHTFYMDDHEGGSGEERHATYHLVIEPNVSVAIGRAIAAILTCYSS
jgi:hypothetical protein